PLTIPLGQRLSGFRLELVPLTSIAAVAFLNACRNKVKRSVRWQRRRDAIFSRESMRLKFQIQNFKQHEGVRPHSRGVDRPSFARNLSLGKQRAQGMPGVRCTRSLACSVENTRVS